MRWIRPKLVYRLYEKTLAAEIKSRPIPNHIGIILDGNRRASKKLGINYELGYELGAEKLEEVLTWCWELDVKVVTCWVFSTENFSRPKEQVESIMHLAKEYLHKIRNDKRIKQNKVKIKVIGRLNMLPENLQNEIKLTEEATEDNENFVLNICMAYGGRAELIDAIRQITSKVKDGEVDTKDINEEMISNHLYTDGMPDPDLIIRTSGEERLSGFLLWQSAFAEYYFADVHWPLFRKIDLWRAIRTFQRRQRRFGT